MKITRCMLTTGFLLATALNIFGADIKVIANNSVSQDTISPSELRSVFLLQKKTLKDGSQVLPVLEKSGSAHDAFVRQYLNRDPDELHFYYQGLVFTGKVSMPKELASDADVVEYVAKTKGAIGYISSACSSEGVKNLFVLSDESKRERALVRRVEPEYPDTLKSLHIGGTVKFVVTIAPKGTVDRVELVGGNPILAETAEKAVRQWVYVPAPSQSKVEVNISF